MQYLNPQLLLYATFKADSKHLDSKYLGYKCDFKSSQKHFFKNIKNLALFQKQKA